MGEQRVYIDGNLEKHTVWFDGVTPYVTHQNEKVRVEVDPVYGFYSGFTEKYRKNLRRGK